MLFRKKFTLAMSAYIFLWWVLLVPLCFLVPLATVTHDDQVSKTGKTAVIGILVSIIGVALIVIGLLLRRRLTSICKLSTRKSSNQIKETIIEDAKDIPLSPVTSTQAMEMETSQQVFGVPAQQQLEPSAITDQSSAPSEQPDDVNSEEDDRTDAVK